MGNQVLGVPQMHMSMDAEQLRQLGYDPETIQVTFLDAVDLRHCLQLMTATQTCHGQGQNLPS